MAVTKAELRGAVKGYITRGRTSGGFSRCAIIFFNAFQIWFHSTAFLCFRKLHQKLVVTQLAKPGHTRFEPAEIQTINVQAEFTKVID